MIHILLKDNRNRLFQKMLYLRVDTEVLICSNINTINKSGHQLNINTIDIETSVEYWEKQGYKNDEALYDKLIIEYNQQNNDLLTGWR
jgi:hypothetical protein